MGPEKFPLVSIGGRAEGPAYADPVAMTPSALVEILCVFNIQVFMSTLVWIMKLVWERKLQYAV